MKPIDLRAAWGLSDDPADWDGVNAEPRPESGPDFDPIAGPIIPGDRRSGTAGGDGPPDPPFAGAGTIDFGATPQGAERKIADLIELDRVLGRMARLRRLQSENEDVVAVEVNRLGDWLEKENEALARRYRDLEAHVRVYAEEHREELGKTRRLPNGKLAWRERKEGVYRLDPNMGEHAARKALLEWSVTAEKGLDAPLTVQKPALDLERVKEFLAAVAEPEQPRFTPPGLEWVPPGETLSIVVEEVKKR